MLFEMKDEEKKKIVLKPKLNFYFLMASKLSIQTKNSSHFTLTIN